MLVYQENDGKGPCVHHVMVVDYVDAYVDINQAVNDARMSPNKRWIVLVGDENYASALSLEYRKGSHATSNLTALENEQVVLVDESEEDDFKSNIYDF